MILQSECRLIIYLCVVLFSIIHIHLTLNRLQSLIVRGKRSQEKRQGLNFTNSMQGKTFKKLVYFENWAKCCQSFNAPAFWNFYPAPSWWTWTKEKRALCVCVCVFCFVFRSHIHKMNIHALFSDLTFTKITFCFQISHSQNEHFVFRSHIHKMNIPALFSMQKNYNKDQYNFETKYICQQ